MAFLPLLILSSSCVRDIDLDQHQEIVIPPKAAIDLIFFSAAPTDFEASSGSIHRLSDATRLEFLDDDYIQNSLVRADFNFRFINSFNNNATAILEFKSASGAVMHRIEVAVPAGDNLSPAVVDITEIIDASEIYKIRRSISLSVSVEMSNRPQPEQGVLELESRGFYYFEF